MKIVYLSSAVLPSRSANSIHVMKMCDAFSKQGHEVLLLAPDDPAAEGNVPSLYSFYGVGESFEVRKLRWLRVKGRGYVYGLESAASARRYRPDLVYGRFVPGCFFSALFGIRVVYESHFPVENHGRVCAWMFRRFASTGRFKRLVVISNALAQHYESRYSLGKELIVVAPDAADEPSESSGFDLGAEGRFRVGYVGHLYAGRGVEIIVEVAKRCRWADFHLVGGTDEDAARWRDRLRGMENITIHGFVPPSETGRYRFACDVLVGPYQERVAVQGGGDTSEWMSPLKIFEYMAAGKAILCSDLPVLREVLAHERNALLCRPADPASWVKALERLRGDPDLRERLGRNARDEYLSKYTWTARAEKVLTGLPE